MLFYEPYFEESNINQKPLIWSQYKIITKIGQIKWQVWFWAKCMKTVRKLSKSVILRNLLEKSNINQKPFIWSQDKIITKFGQKKMGAYGFGPSVRKLRKIII